MKLGIITGTTRPGNVGTSVGEWVIANLPDLDGVEIVDLKVADYDLDLLNEPTHPAQANGNYENPKTATWSKAVADVDAFLFVTGEYNGAPPAAFKNAADVLYAEWNGKAVGLVGYGYGGAKRSIGTWRNITRALRMKTAESTLNFYLGDELVDGTFTPADGKVADLAALVDEVLQLHDAP
ncbi:NADPH-dependent FMN reductase [uncultured Corynebacterium sp.]|uniref:NADPH-dependent FMN reductase n=1 Tax=uncultured Corynebacterium sp. TaxID=159447 RepID=UPI0025CDB61B|nr:NADPH-dependent FMN reductase [uncultured Corynebacterium sp.]